MAEVIHGDAYGNNLVAYENRTQVYGLAGDDTLSSDGKSEVLLIGGSGNDVLNISGGVGTLSGGAGADTFNLTYSSAKSLSVVIEDVDPYADKIVITREDGTAQLSYAIDGNDVIWTDAQGNFSLTLKASSDASDYFDGTASDEIWEVLQLVNEEREYYGLNALTLSQALTDAAQIRSGELISLFSHTRPDGSDCFTAVTKSYWSLGENIAAGYYSSEDVMEGWMNSEGHRANILNSGFTKLGVGYTYDDDTTYQEHWVQMFGGDLQTPDTRTTDELLSVSMDTGSAKTYFYMGGYQTISNYAGEPIFLGEFPTGLNFSGNTFDFYSATGALTITNARDKVIDLRDGNGNDFAKACASTTPCTMDGRTLNGFSCLVGSDAGSNTILAGNTGSYLWGNTGNAFDLLIGGASYDTFFVGKYDGNDAIQNASSADSVNLYDVTLDDIALTTEDSGTVGIAFKSGNVITIQSTDDLSAKINLADGSAYRYNHESKFWQTA